MDKSNTGLLGVFYVSWPPLNSTHTWRKRESRGKGLVGSVVDECLSHCDIKVISVIKPYIQFFFKAL